MRKVVISLVLMSAFVFANFAVADPVFGFPIVLNLTWDNPSSGHNEPERSLIPFPEVSIDGHTIYFEGNHEFFTLELYDESDVLIYTTDVSNTAAQVVIPDTIIGTYEIRLCTENYYFYGMVNL